MTPKDFQTSLMNAGFALPKYGADSDYGSETANATSAWFDSGKDIEVVTAGTPPPPNVDKKSIVPLDWMPECKMQRVIVHWTAGAYIASENDRSHYHILIEGSGKLVRGTFAITANVSTNDADGYAAHTLGTNSGSVGISACAMAGALENPFRPGTFPLLEDQWSTTAHVAADVSRRYGIAVTEKTVLQHGEVEKQLGIAQRGKWDICRLPWAPSLTSAQVCDLFRAEVRKYL